MEPCIRWGSRSPRGKANLGVWKALGVCCNVHKNGWTDQDAIWGADSHGPNEPCIRWRLKSVKGKGQFWVIHPSIKKHYESAAVYAKNSWTDREDVWGKPHVGPRNNLLDGAHGWTNLFAAARGYKTALPSVKIEHLLLIYIIKNVLITVTLSWIRSWAPYVVVSSIARDGTVSLVGSMVDKEWCGIAFSCRRKVKSDDSVSIHKKLSQFVIVAS